MDDSAEQKFGVFFPPSPKLPLAEPLPGCVGTCRQLRGSPEEGWPRQEPIQRNSSAALPGVKRFSFIGQVGTGSPQTPHAPLTPGSPQRSEPLRLQLPSGALRSPKVLISEIAHEINANKNLKYELHLQQLPSLLNSPFKVWGVGFFKF